jgi:O-antigen/teichoic acid export membrane protein
MSDAEPARGDLLHRLLRQSSVYTLSGVAGKVAGVILTALYVNTEFLPKEDFGYFGTIRATMMIALLVAGVGLPLGIIRFATSSAVAVADRAAVPATALLMAVFASSLTAAVLWFAAPLLAGVLALDPTRTEPIHLLALYVGVKSIADVSYTELRRRERAGLYVIASASETAVMTGAISYFLVVERAGLLGVLQGYVLSAAVAAVILTAVLLTRIERRVSWAIVRPMLAYGGPLILSGLAGRFLYFGDRFVITQVLGLGANARYELAAMFGGLVHAFLVQGFQMAFAVVGMKAFDEEGTAALHRRTFRHFTAVSGFAVLGLGLFASDAVRLVGATDPDYLDIDGLVLLIAGGFAFYGLYYIVVNVLYASGRTTTVASSVVLAAIVNMGLNLVFVPMIGIAGAAAATLVAYALLAISTGAEAERVKQAHYPWRVVGIVVLMVTGLWLAGQPAASLGLLPRLAVRAALVLAYAPLLVALGVYGRADWEQLRALVRARRGAGT